MLACCVVRFGKGWMTDGSHGRERACRTAAISSSGCGSRTWHIAEFRRAGRAHRCSMGAGAGKSDPSSAASKSVMKARSRPSEAPTEPQGKTTSDTHC
jgi:hypothetical protein